MMIQDQEGNWVDDGQDQDPYHDPSNYAPAPAYPTAPVNTPAQPGDSYGGPPANAGNVGGIPGWAPDPNDPNASWLYTNPATNTPGPTAPPRPGGGGYGGGGMGNFSYPDFVPPNITFNPFVSPEMNVQPFQYGDYQPLTADTFQADPGYEFRAEQMDRAIKNDKSAKGLLATGNTLADLMSYRGGLASQEYGNVEGRNFRNWDANRNKAFQGWQTEYQLGGDKYKNALTDYLTNYQVKSDDWNRGLTTYQTNLGKEESAYGLNLENQGNSFNNLLSLYKIMTSNLPTYSPSA